MMDALAPPPAEQFAHAGYPPDAAAILLCECDGTPAESPRPSWRSVADICRAAGASGCACRGRGRAAAASGPGRKGAFPAMGRIAPDYYCIDGTIPRRQLPEVLAGDRRAVAGSYGLRSPTCSTPATATCIR